MTRQPGQKLLVTGGGGFLGAAVVRRLVARGDQVRSLARGFYPELQALGVDQRRGDLGNPDDVDGAVRSMDGVFHIAAKPGVAGPFAEYYRVNVLGTRHVLDACLRHGVSRLVHTSSPSVVFHGSDQEGVGAEAAYPRHFLAAYPETKALAEQLVLAANGAALATCALRPHLIWGPGDPHLVRRLVERARHGRLAIVGRGDKLVDAVYIDNAADAHLLAFDRLSPGAALAGKALFITNNEPWPLRQLIDGILAAAALPPVSRQWPPRLAYGLGWALERLYSVMRTDAEPPLTRFVARQLATAHWYDHDAAEALLGYHPAVSMREGLKRLAEGFVGDGTA